MDAISPKDVRNLLQETAPPRVSIYMPTFAWRNGRLRTGSG